MPFDHETLMRWKKKEMCPSLYKALERCLDGIYLVWLIFTDNIMAQTSCFTAIFHSTGSLKNTAVGKLNRIYGKVIKSATVSSKHWPLLQVLPRTQPVQLKLIRMNVRGIIWTIETNNQSVLCNWIVLLAIELPIRVGHLSSPCWL